MGLVLAAPAFAAPAYPDREEASGQVTALQKKLPAMQKQITTLQKQVKTLTNVLSGWIDYSICSNAVTADALQQTWATLNISSDGRDLRRRRVGRERHRQLHSRGRSRARPPAYRT